MAQIINELQDLTYLSWTKTRGSSGTAGSFLKSYEDTMNGKKYYKLSNYDPYYGITGHECVNEIIVDRLLTILGIAHLSYELIHAKIIVDDKEYITWLCASNDYKKKGEHKIALDVYYQVEREKEESPLEFCVRKGWEAEIYQMLIVDFLILNRDRHGANMEVLTNKITKTERLAPLFDHGVSLLSRCPDVETMLKEDLLDDKPVQCFVGSHSALSNLSLIPADKHPQINQLKGSNLNTLTEGLSEALDEKYLERIKEMIWRRWQVYENLRNKR